MYNWFENEKLGIWFDKIPSVGIRYILPSMKDEEKKSVEKYPFVCRKELRVRIRDYKNHKYYDFVIPKGYCYDGASIPRFFWRIIGASTDNRFLIPALIHDVLCENHGYINNDRSLSTEVFNALLEASGISKLKRFLMKNSVACFQKIFCKW